MGGDHPSLRSRPFVAWWAVMATRTIPERSVTTYLSASFVLGVLVLGQALGGVQVQAGAGRVDRLARAGRIYVVRSGQEEVLDFAAGDLIDRFGLVFQGVHGAHNDADVAGPDRSGGELVADRVSSPG